MTHSNGEGTTPEQGPAIALTVAYDGAPFSGFARQRAVPTVQGALEEALATALRREVQTAVAGRTDAGVHALGQVVSFDAQGDEPEPIPFARSIDALVGEHIAVNRVRYARPGFSARFDALSREYRYRIALGPVPPVFTDHVAWWLKGDLDLEAMAEGAQALLGEHDFRSFCVPLSAKKGSTVREIRELDFSRGVELGEEVLTIRVQGRAFLHSMVRVLVGTLVEVGKGRRSTGWVSEALAARERAAAGPTAPAHGLTLWGVEYPQECWLEGVEPREPGVDTPGSV